MDIGDPSEIPATRKKLPSMQELGAFDFNDPTPPGAGATRPAALDTRPAPLETRPAPIDVRPATPTTRPRPNGQEAATADAPVSPATVAKYPAPPTPTPTPASARPPLTPEQLRQALAKANPATREKLLRLIAGGQSVQQVRDGAADGARRRSLVMEHPTGRPKSTADGWPQAPVPTSPTTAAAAGSGSATPSPPTAPPAPGHATGPFASAAAAPPRRPAAARPAPGGLVMQIDENTDLLDAAPAPGDRRASMQAQVDAALNPPATAAPAPRMEPAAAKVVFPAYDPSRDGEPVSSQGRRRPEGPIEGHFPAPRQPFAARYKHPDGRPMSAEENKVEEVLQAQRCDETLSVLAREGVNGLLLSPRDLDAAVANGLLTAETAATLWKTWAALRPVIHVIEDEAEVEESDPDPAAAAHADVLAGPASDPAGAAAPDVAPDAAPDAAPDVTPHAASTAAPAAPTPIVAGIDTATPVSSAASDSPADAVDEAARAPAPAVAVAAPPGDVRQRPAAPSTLPGLGNATGPAPGASQRTPPPARGADPRVPKPRTPTSSLPAAAAGPTRGTSLTWALSTPRQRLAQLLRSLFWVFCAYSVLVTGSRLALLAWHRWGHLLSA